MFELVQSSHFSKWLGGLNDRTARLRILTRLNRLETGHFGDVKAVGAGIFELRIDSGPGFRIYFARRGAQLILLLCGGDKSTQSRDIARARIIASSFGDKE